MAQPTMPPPHLLQRIANNPSAEDFARSFGPLGKTIRSYLKEAGLDFSSLNHILDFGCGVGRFMFAFQETLGPDQRIWGCEVHEGCARWCQENIDFAETAHTSIDPPLPYPDRQFDFVYALSVYTHLRLDMQFRWAAEIHRVLRPGGILFATIHGPQFFPVFHASRHQTERDEMYCFGDDGLFAYVGFPSGEGADQGQVQVASAHTPSFFQEQFSAFELVRRFPNSRLAGGQDLYIIRKSSHGRTIEASDSYSWPERLDPSGETTPVELTFNLDGHQRFRVFPSLQQDGSYQPEYRVEIRAGDTVLADERSRPNNKRVIGPTHHKILDLPVPAHQGEVTVRLSTIIRDRGTLPADAAPEVNWCFPHFS